MNLPPIGEETLVLCMVLATMAGALLGSIPVALIYSFFVKYYVAGLTAGAVKG